MTTIQQALFAIALGAGIHSAAQAAPLANGQFSNSLVSWQSLGDVATSGGVATLTSAYVDGSDDATNLNVSGQAPALVQAEGLEAFAGLPQGALDVLGEAVEGSVLKQSFFANAGDTLSFQWSFSTLETQFNDLAFVGINGTMTTLSSVLGQLGSGGTFSHTFTQSGNVTLAFGVIDMSDTSATSTLSISQVTQTPAVPEPETWAMVFVGASVLLSRRRLQRRS